MSVVDRVLWAKEKEAMYTRMLEDLDVGYLDPDIYYILIELFRRPEAFPVSSCSGRITVVDAPMPWHRKRSTIVFKKHSVVDENEVSPIVSRGPPLTRLWLVVTGPIFHVSTLTMREALALLRVARGAGMKHSGILSVSRRGIYVELKTGVRLTVLLRAGDYVVSNLGEIVRAANEALLEGKDRLLKFYGILKKFEGP